MPRTRTLPGARLSGVRVAAAVDHLRDGPAGLAGSIGAAQSVSAQASDDFSFAFAAIAAVLRVAPRLPAAMAPSGEPWPGCPRRSAG